MERYEEREGKGVCLDRRFAKEGNKHYNIETVWEHQREILRLVALGWSNGRIAEEVGITPQTVSNVRNSAVGRVVLKELSGKRDEEVVNIARRVQEFLPLALDILEDVIKGDYEEASLHLRVNTAKHYLSMGGHGPVHKVASLSGSLTREELDAIKAKARESAKDLGVIVDINEYSDVSGS